MQWQLSHFGLELGSSSDYLRQAGTRCDKYIDDVEELSGEEGGIKQMGTVMDSYLDAPKTEESMNTVFGYIELATPIIRPECLDQIPKVWPFVKPMGKSKSLSFYDEGTEERVSAMTLLEHLSRFTREDTIVHGNRFIEHNVKAHPSEMFIEILPVPSLVVCGSNKNFMSPLRKKLNQIVFWNNELKKLLKEGDTENLLLSNAPAIDILDILTWQVYTYMDNAIPGIQSDTELPRGIAQMLGTECRSLDGTDLNHEDVAGTHLQRIVRGINMGEPAIHIIGKGVGGDGENLAFELAKQVAFRRIWNKSSEQIQVMHIDRLGEVNRMEQGVIEDYEWTPWDGQGKLSRDIILAPRYALRRPNQPKNSEVMMSNLAKIREINEHYYIAVEAHRALTYLHSVCEGYDLAEPLIIVCDADIDSLMLRPVIREMETLNKMGINICLLMTTYTENVATYAYSATPDEYRNLKIAITEIRERKEFSQKDKMFDHIDEITIQLISTYFKGFSRKDIVRIVGSSILSKSRIDVDYIREYITQELKQGEKSTSHLKPRPRKKHRKLTLEQLHDQAGGRFIEFIQSSDERKQNSIGMTNIQIPEEQRKKPGSSLYDSLKGMEPLVRWIQNKGRLFSPEAKEFGFIRYPTGLLLTGVPGCGKTMTGKIIAEEWGMDFKRVNVDDIISRFVGGNEDNMAKLLKELDERAPIVCFVDEADKLFTDMSNAPAHHVVHATMSTESLLLQFMEENTKPIFFVFTANEISNLSGPLVDRFDESFFVDLPSQNAREQIIQLMLYERKKGDLGLDAGALAELSKGFSGRDIRSAIEEGMMGAFTEGREVEEGDLVKSFNQTVPTSTLQSKKIKELRKLVKDGKIRSANTDPWTEKWT